MSTTSLPPAPAPAPAAASPAPAAPAVPADPILSKSYSVPIVLAMLAVVAATVLAVADEMWFRRPYKRIQGQYREVYSAYLDRLISQREEVEKTLHELPAFQQLDKAATEAGKAVDARKRELEAELQSVTNQGRALSEAVKTHKSEIAAYTYQAEHATEHEGRTKVDASEEAREIIEEKIHKVQERELSYTWIVKDASGAEKESTEKGKVRDLLAKALALEETKAKLQTKLVEETKTAVAAAKARDQWLADNRAHLEHAIRFLGEDAKQKIADAGAARFLESEVVTIDPTTLRSIRDKVEEIPHGWTSFLRGDLRQLHLAEAVQSDAAQKGYAANWIDRCETCHLNVREPFPITQDALRRELTAAGWSAEKIDSEPLRLFTSHPNRALLAKHDPERFGCSTCHNGNGVAVTSKELAHGTNFDWLWPLHPKENIEAGCVQCHRQDLVLPMGERVTNGKDTFRRAGCWGCHKYQGFNTEVDRITSLEGRLKEIDASVAERTRTKGNLAVVTSAIPGDEEADAAIRAVKDRENAERIRRQTAIQQDIANLVTERQQLSRRLGEAYVERQRVGPNLKDLRAKLLPEFITEWLKSPRDAHKDASGDPFRAGTKMPTLRWNDEEEVRDAAAFLWQSALDPAKYPELQLPAFQQGDAAKGKETFETVGCLACHSMGRGKDRIGNDYAANLSDLGEKNRPEYVMRWVTDPRHRLVGYDPAKKQGERDIAGSKDPQTSPDLVWAQHTIMPNLRLSEEEARNITTYLTSQRRSDVKYEPAPWLADPARVERGRKIVLFQGCAGCHEIAGIEDEKGIGTELTEEGSKPLERLDFAHLTHAAERGHEPLKEWRTLEDNVQLFDKDEPWYRPRGFILHKVAQPDIYDTAKYLPDRFTRLRMPQFRFSAQELLDVTTFVLGSVESKIPETFRYRPDERGQAIRDGWWVIRKYNCQGCHQVTPLDVPALWNAPYFAQRLKENGGRDLATPPTLVGVGFRVRPDFLAQFLRDPSLGGGRERPKSLRPHLTVRMPTFEFSDDEIAKLVRFFQAMANQPFADVAKAVRPIQEGSPEHQVAKAIYSFNGSCVQCHIVDGMAPNKDTKAPNLSYSWNRLNPDWMRRWIADPPAMNPATSMLPLFGSAPAADHRWHYMSEGQIPGAKELPEDHIELMVRYLLSRGLVGK